MPMASRPDTECKDGVDIGYDAPIVSSLRALRLANTAEPCSCSIVAAIARRRRGST